MQKQQVIFAAMLAVGGGLLTASLLTERFLAAEGMAFMLVGLAGLLMSWTTFGIGAGIKKTVREVGRKNWEALDRTLDRILEAQRESQKETRELIDKMSESQDRISKSQDSIARLLERVVKNSGA